MAATADPSPPAPDSSPADPVLLAGFDAGQTHTTCRLADGSGAVLAEGDGPGVVHLAAPDGPARFTAALRQSLEAARARLTAGWQPVPLAAAAVGASGIEAGSPVQSEGQALAAAALELPMTRLAVTGDERTALRGAFPAGPGIVVISGTGTIAVGRDGRGREHRCAGWGWLLDGAGSAMDIGRDGLALSLRMADGREPLSPLLDALWRGLELDPADPQAAQRIKAMVVDPHFGAAGFAKLAPLVNRLAEEGDQQAITILEHNAAALAAMAAAVATSLELQSAPICAMGGALEHLGELRRRFAALLASRLEGSSLVSANGDACQGALRQAADCLQSSARGA
jgi:phenylacetic acid degradation operon negative regulatory protein